MGGTVLVAEQGGGLTTALRARAGAAGMTAHCGVALTTRLPIEHPALVDAIRRPLPTDRREILAAVADVVGTDLLVIDEGELLEQPTVELLIELAETIEVVVGVHRGIASAATVCAALTGAGFESVELGLIDAPAEIDEPAAIGGRRIRRLDARLESLGSDAEAWLARVGVLGGPATTAVVGAPPKVLVDQRLAHLDGGTWAAPTSLIERAVHRLAAADLDAERRALAEVVDDGLTAARLLSEAGDRVAAACAARAGLGEARSADERASLLAFVAAGGSDVDGAAAVAALLRRERPREASSLLVAAGSRSLLYGEQLALGRQLGDDAARRAALEQAGTAEREVLRARWWLEYRPPATPPVDPMLADVLSWWTAGAMLPGERWHRSAAPTDDLDLSRWQWSIELLALGLDRGPDDPRLCEALAELDRQARSIGRQSWSAFAAGAAAIAAVHRADALPDAIDALPPVAEADLAPHLPRSFVLAHRAVALADLGRTQDAFAALDPLADEVSAAARSLRAWATAEVELAAGHPVRAARVGEHHPGGSSPGDVLLAVASSWGAFEAGLPFTPARPPNGRGPR